MEMTIQLETHTDTAIFISISFCWKSSNTSNSNLSRNAHFLSFHICTFFLWQWRTCSLSSLRHSFLWPISLQVAHPLSPPLPRALTSYFAHCPPPTPPLPRSYLIVARTEPGRLRSMGSQRVGHDWATSLVMRVHCIARGSTKCSVVT